MEKSGMTNRMEQCKLPTPTSRFGLKGGSAADEGSNMEMAKMVGSARRARWTSLAVQGAFCCRTWERNSPARGRDSFHSPNGVTSVNTLADATMPEKILLAAFQLEEEGKSPFSAE